MFWWFTVYSPQTHWPLSGAVAQDIHPALLAQAGDRGVEREVLSDVASYGKQLGLLGCLLLKVAHSLPSDKLDKEGQDAVAELEKQVTRIDAIKKRYKRQALTPGPGVPGHSPRGDAGPLGSGPALAPLNPPSLPMPSPPATTSSSRRR